MPVHRLRFWGLLVNLVTGGAALTMGGWFLFRKQFEYRSELASAVTQGELRTEQGVYQIQDGGTMSYALEGLRIDVKPVTDEELNRRFPEESAQGNHSTNPYTYGE